MQPRLRALLLLLALAGCAGPAGAPGDSPNPGDCKLATDAEQLAAEFRELRAVEGHFTGGAWNADVDRWMGRKHQIMVELGLRLGAGNCSTAQVIQLLGSPDQVAREGDILFEQVSRLPEFEKPAAGQFEILIYAWRGMHDLLYFTTQADRVLSSGWWYAGDQ